MGRLIIVSNRLPFAIERKHDELSLRQSSGGLVSAIKSYLDRVGNAGNFEEKVWVGSVDFSPQDFEAMQGKLDELSFRMVPLFIEKPLYVRYYNGFSNSTLWPLFHYFPSLVEYKKEDFEAYQEVNKLFSEKLSSIVRKDDVVWIHDYQLMIVPSLLRKQIPEVAIGFFLHIPFPSYEIFRLLPGFWKTTLIHGMLGADIIGFHTLDYVQHFIQSVKMLIGLDNQFTSIQYNMRLIRVDLFPIGIDYDKFENACQEPDIVRIRKEIHDNFKDRKIIFSVDRLDYTKGLNRRLEGFEIFLDQFPEWREKVVFILNIVPSRDTIDAYTKRRRMLEEKISTLNGRFGNLHWQPIIYRYQHLEFKELAALYQIADVALITPLRDGMNLVAKEYIASCMNREGMLILSELAGAASELNEAILVNPTDVSEVANAIADALQMPVEEKEFRMQMMKSRLKEYDVIKWVSDFLEQLDSIKKEQLKHKAKVLDSNAIEQIQQRYQKAERRSILLDYDGTLTPFTQKPEEAIPASSLMRILEVLCRDERNDITIISGRDHQTLEKWLGKLPLNLVAEHGAMNRTKNGDWEKLVSISPSSKNEIRSIMQVFVSRCQGSFIEEKENTLAWHYRNTPADLGFIRSRELMNTLVQFVSNTRLQVLDGNKVIEIRQAGVDKGTSALRLVSINNPDFILCLGDDTTDEDMFRSLGGNAITVKVGGGNTKARYTILGQQEVLPFLQKIINSPILKIPDVPTQV